MARQRAGGSPSTTRFRSSSRRGLRLRVSHRRAEPWQPPSKDDLHERDIIGRTDRPTAKIKKKRRKKKK